MSTSKSRFSSLAQAVRERTAEPERAGASPDTSRPTGAGVHKPAAALSAVGETLRDHICRLEAELAQATSTNAGLVAELERIKGLREKAGDDGGDFLFLQADSIVDRLPTDRLRGRSEGREFEELLLDIESNGQNDAITVRRGPDGTFEIASGRRRLEVCKRLQRPVLARVRDLDERAMLRIQFSENERRADISALERARWFAEVRDRLKSTAKEIAAQFGVDPSTFSLYLRLARFPEEILNRLDEPQRLAVLPARRIMEVIESDATAVQRIVGTLDAYQQAVSRTDAARDPAAQIDLLIRAAEGRNGAGEAGSRSPVPDRRHIVHQGRRIGTLTRNGGQWVFRFATSIPEKEVHVLVDRLAIPVSDSEGRHPTSSGSDPVAKRK
jgi:ParB family chromosome partitioning protein